MSNFDGECFRVGAKLRQPSALTALAAIEQVVGYREHMGVAHPLVSKFNGVCAEVEKRAGMTLTELDGFLAQAPNAELVAMLEKLMRPAPSDEVRAEDPDPAEHKCGCGETETLKQLLRVGVFQVRFITTRSEREQWAKDVVKAIGDAP